MSEPALIVVGGGIAGAAAALRAAQYALPAVWLRGTRDTHRSSRAAYVKNIDNMVGVHPDIVRTKVLDELSAEHPDAAARVSSMHMHVSTVDIVRNAEERIRAQWDDVVTIVDEAAVDAERTADGFRLTTSAGRTLAAPNVVLATGVMDRQPIVHKQRGGRTLEGIRWLFPYANQESLLYCIRCEGHLTRGRRVGVIGAGPSAAEIALMIRERYGSDVTILTAGEERAWGEERARLLELEGVRVVDGKLVDVHGAGGGRTLHGFSVEGHDERVELDFAFVSMGLYRVFNDLAVTLGAELEQSERPAGERHVLVGTWGETSVPGLFAVGDMAARTGEPMMKQVYTSQEYAVRAVDTIDRRRRRAGRDALLARGQ